MVLPRERKECSNDHPFCTYPAHFTCLKKKKKEYNKFRTRPPPPPPALHPFIMISSHPSIPLPFLDPKYKHKEGQVSGSGIIKGVPTWRKRRVSGIEVELGRGVGYG